ncbi:MAG: hypothetical protein HOE90_02445 [Bacteriovoracaceae bacterium]|jgi:hypothetical protein|nr:hypothetical protein [Bacteriovoracaceae bacterium]
MNSDLNDCYEDLMNSEHLNAFSVIELFCEQCADLTPHHIDESKSGKEKYSTPVDRVLISPISVHECVICRENEETLLTGLKSQ